MSIDKKSEKPFLDFGLLRRIIRLTYPYRSVFFLSIFMAIALAVASVGTPVIIIYVSNHFISRTHFDLKKLEYFSMILLVLLVAQSLLRYTFNYATAWLGQSIVRDLRL